MGDTLETGPQSPERSDGRGWCMVRPDWGFEHRASPLAICRSRREKSAKRDELGCRRMGGDGSQDGSFDSKDEEQDLDSNAMESSGIGDMEVQ